MVAVWMICARYLFATRAFERMKSCRPVLICATSWGMESGGSALKAPDEAKEAKDCWSLIRFQRPELMRSLSWVTSLERVASRSPIWMIWDYMQCSVRDRYQDIWGGQWGF